MLMVTSLPSHDQTAPRLYLLLLAGKVERATLTLSLSLSFLSVGLAAMKAQDSVADM